MPIHMTYIHSNNGVNDVHAFCSNIFIVCYLLLIRILRPLFKRNIVPISFLYRPRHLSTEDRPHMFLIEKQIGNKLSEGDMYNTL